MMTEPQPVTYFSRLDADECWALISECEVGRVAWASAEGISVVPVNFRVVDGVRQRSRPAMLDTHHHIQNVHRVVRVFCQEKRFPWNEPARIAFTRACLCTRAHRLQAHPRNVIASIGRVVSARKVVDLELVVDVRLIENLERQGRPNKVVIAQGCFAR